MRQKMGKEENCTKHTRLPQYKHVDEGYFWLNGSNWLLRVGEGEQSESNSRKKKCGRLNRAICQATVFDIDDEKDEIKWSVFRK